MKAANEQAPQLDLGSTMKSLEEKYHEMIAENETYLSLNHTNYDAGFKLTEGKKEAKP